MILSDTLSGLAYRFRLIVDGLRNVVPEHQTKDPASCPLVGVIWTSLGRRLERFGRILARAQAGIPDPVWPSRAGRRAAPRKAEDAADTAPARKPRLPTRAGWLMVMMPWVVAPYGSQLRYWLMDPDAEALVRSSRQMRRLLRPLLRSLSTDPLPECLLEPASVDAPEPTSDEALGGADGAPAPGPGREQAADGAETVREAAAPGRHGVARGRAAPVVATVLSCATQAAPAEPPPVAGYGFRSALVDAPPRDWWSVQDERRRAALAIARGSVCRA